MELRHVLAIIWKQCKDTIKNKAVLLQFLMFPVLSSIMTLSVNRFDLSPEYFVILFVTMYITMTPIIVLSTIISEEKEKGTLRMMIMSNVKPLEYLIGVSLYVFVLCLIGVIAMGLIASYPQAKLGMFVSINACGLLVSIVIGAMIGMVGKNQSSATGLSVPAMLICAFVPMISMFNSDIKTVAQFLYSQQVNELLTNLSVSQVNMEGFLIMFANFVLMLCLYLLAFRKGRYFQS